jgi:hypothetical protein
LTTMIHNAKTWPAKHGYKPTHVRPGCLCPTHVFEDSENGPITSLLLKGYIPFVLVSGSSVEIASFHAEAEVTATFVAISHVRSQGLGNWQSNSLPLCQLSRLQDLVNNMYVPSRHPVPFWIDTACIPHNQPGKAIAFEALGSIFRSADAVLALDVSTIGSDTASAKQNILKIRSSMWAKRLWTIREGALAKSLQVQFKNNAVDLDGIIQQYSINEDNSLISWTGPVNKIKDLSMLEESNTAFIDLLLLFERDLRAALGKVPSTRTSTKEEEPSITMEHKKELRAILWQCYRSTLRYRYFSSPSDSVHYKRLRIKVEQIYQGISYNALLKQQEISLAKTLERLEEIRTFRRGLELSTKEG